MNWHTLLLLERYKLIINKMLNIVIYLLVYLKIDPYYKHFRSIPTICLVTNLQADGSTCSNM